MCDCSCAVCVDCEEEPNAPVWEALKVSNREQPIRVLTLDG